MPLSSQKFCLFYFNKFAQHIYPTTTITLSRAFKLQVRDPGVWKKTNPRANDIRIKATNHRRVFWHNYFFVRDLVLYHYQMNIETTN